MRRPTTSLTSALTMLIIFLVLGVQSRYVSPDFTNKTHRPGAQGNQSAGESFIEKRFDISSYEWWNAIELHQFEYAPQYYTNMVLHALIQVMDCLSYAQFVVTEQKGLRNAGIRPTNPSLLRYMPDTSFEYLDTVSNVFQRLNAVIGIGPWSHLQSRSCYLPPAARKIHFYYLDPPGSVTDQPRGICQTGTPGGSPVAYYFHGTYTGLSGIVFCAEFFNGFKRFDGIDRDRIGPYLQYGEPWFYHEPAYFSAEVVLHELLHYVELFGDIFSTPFSRGNIIDISLRKKQEGSIHQALGAWWARTAKSRDWEWLKKFSWDEAALPDNQRNPLFNAENWVMFVMEVYTRQQLLRRAPDMQWWQWQDSPDARTGPHIPNWFPFFGT